MVLALDNAPLRIRSTNVSPICYQALAATPPRLVFPAVGTASQHTPLQLNPAQQSLRACERADSAPASSPVCRRAYYVLTGTSRLRCESVDALTLLVGAEGFEPSTR